MRRKGRIVIKGIVQGVGFRPFVYAEAARLGIRGHVKNLGSEVEIVAYGDRFEEFLEAVSRGTPLSRIDVIDVSEIGGEAPGDFTIRESGTGTLSGLVPPDVAICGECIADIEDERSRYHEYWATSCVNCGPRYSIIRSLPYDRERTSMEEFPMCEACRSEYGDPSSRRHHAQTIACERCGPRLLLLDRDGRAEPTSDPVGDAVAVLEAGGIVAIKGIGGFHIACTEETSGELKRRLGRPRQPLAIMIRPDALGDIAIVNSEEWELLRGVARPIVVLEKRDPSSHREISPLHNIGCMLPYSGLHHLLFARLASPLLIMTSANMPGYPMFTTTEEAVARLKGCVDHYLVHDRPIVNRCDDSVIRDGFVIRLSRGYAPKRRRIDLGRRCILGVGPELNSNITIYRDGFCVTSPHIGHVRNPQTLEYLVETEMKLAAFLGASYDAIAHDLHPTFLSTKYALSLAEKTNATLFPVQHHHAHVAATTLEPCIGITIDGVGYGEDGHVWGGEVFDGEAPCFRRVAHLAEVPMPGGDLATRFPERMLYGILPCPEVQEMLSARGWSDTELSVLERQVERRVNLAWTSSTGRVLDAAAALLGLCRERTYDGEPAMTLEAAAANATPEEWPLVFSREGGLPVLSTREMLREALGRWSGDGDVSGAERGRIAAKIAASVQFNLARGIAKLAIDAAHNAGIGRVALSGGVAYNRMIRETIAGEIAAEGLTLVMNHEYPLGDGCISFGQCICAALLMQENGP
ncbi:MAG: carbamoyltransferase HypF [Methanomicrobiales archaeon]|nr:carbamoyltransferase HypF [Methanomicrobiales archaeon]